MENNTSVIFVNIENGEYEDEEYSDHDGDYDGDGDGGDDGDDGGGGGDDDGMAEAEVGCAAF